MTSREVIDNLLRKKKAERVGVTDAPWGDTLRKWAGEGYPVDQENNPVSPLEHFGFDVCGVGGWFDVAPLRGTEEIVEETDERVIK